MAVHPDSGRGHWAFQCIAAVSYTHLGQDTLKDGGTRYDELGVFLPLEHFADRLERHVETATKIVYGE